MFHDVMDESAIRKFKKKFYLNEEIIFLNHGSFGATPRVVIDKFRYWQERLERQPVLFLGREISELLRVSRNELALFLHTAPDNLVYVSNATYGLNVIARSLNLNPEDEVLTTNHEYGAIDRTWQFLSEQYHFTYRNYEIKLPVTSSEEFIQDLFSSISNKTKVLFISHITSPTALIFPVKEICERAREKGLITVVDGAHAPGQIDLNLDELNADFYVGNLHKWLCAPKGSAFLYANPNMQKTICPLVVSWGWKSQNPSQSQFQDYLEWTGTQDFSAYLSVPEAINFYKVNNVTDIRKRCHNLAKELNSILSKIYCLPPLMTSDTWYGQMISIPLPNSVENNQLKENLYNLYNIEVPIIEWNNSKFIRVSIQGYNTCSELKFLVDVLQDLIH